MFDARPRCFVPLAGFLVRAEYRRDFTSEATFPGPGGSDDLRRAQPTALVGAIWVLGTKKGTR